MAISINDPDNRLSTNRGTPRPSRQAPARLSTNRQVARPMSTTMPASVARGRRLTTKQRQLASRLGFTPEELPEFRSERQDPSLTSAVFDLLGRFESGVTGVLSEGLGAIRNKKNPFEVVGSAISGGYEGLLGDTAYSASSLYSQLIDDPYAEKTFDRQTLDTLRSGGARLAAGIGGGIGLDPTTYIPLVGMGKVATKVAKAIPGVETAAKGVSKVARGTGAYRKAAETGKDIFAKFSTSFERFGADKLIKQMRRSDAVRSELSSGVNKFLTGALDDRGFKNLKVDTRSVLKRAGATDDVVKSILQDLDKGFEQIKNLKNQGVDLTDQGLQKQIQRQMTGVDRATFDKFTTKEGKETIERLQEELAVLDDTIKGHPGRKLQRYANKGGELAETTGQGRGVFSKQGDEVAQELGFVDSEAARESFEEYSRLVDNRRVLSDELRDATTRVRETVTNTGYRADLEEITQPWRRAIDEVMTPQLVKQGLIDPETASKGMGEYLRTFYEKSGALDDPEVAKVLKNLTRSDVKIGAEAGQLKRKKTDIERAFEYFAENKGSLPVTFPAERVKEITREFNKIKKTSLDDALEYAEKAFADNVLSESQLRAIANQQRLNRGLIEDASLILPVTLDQGFRLAERHSFLSTVAKQLGVEGLDPATALEQGFKQIPDIDKYGSLKGLFVPKYLADDIIGMVAPPKNWLTDVTNIWKQFMLFAPFQTATNSRNVISNTVFMTLGEDAPSMPNAIKYMGLGMQEVEKGGKYYDELREAGALANVFASRDIYSKISAKGDDILAKVQRGLDEGIESAVPAVKNLPAPIRGGIKRVTSTQGARISGFGFGQEAFQFTDEAGKVGLYRWYREAKGLSKEKSLELMEKSMANPANLPEFVRSGVLPGTGIRVADAIPFLSFKYYAGQLFFDTVMNRTSKITGLGKLQRGVESLTYEKENDVDLPSYIRANRQNYIRLPWLDEQGNPKYLDLTYLLPYGDVVGGFEPQDIILGNPILRTGFEVGTGRSLFFDREIVPAGTPEGEKLGLTLGYAASNLLPRSPIIPGSSQFDKLKATVENRLDRFGRDRDLGTTVTDIFLGVKAREVDPTLERQYNQYALERSIRDVRTQQNRVMRDQSLTLRERQQRLSELNNEIMRLESAARSGIYAR